MRSLAPLLLIDAFEAALAINPHHVMLKLEIIRLRHSYKPLIES